MSTGLFLLTFLILTSPTRSTASSCLNPTSKQLRSFFENKPLWTEVRSSQSRIIASRDVIQFDIDFDKPQNSKIKKGDKDLGKLSKLCFNKQSKTLFLGTKVADIQLSKTHHGSIKSALKVFGLTLTYYYRPEPDVLRDTSGHTSDPNQWNSSPKETTPITKKASRLRRLSNEHF